MANDQCGDIIKLICLIILGILKQILIFFPALIFNIILNFFTCIFLYFLKLCRGMSIISKSDLISGQVKCFGFIIFPFLLLFSELLMMQKLIGHGLCLGGSLTFVLTVYAEDVDRCCVGMCEPFKLMVLGFNQYKSFCAFQYIEALTALLK